jgi:hypothetical protein
MLHCGRESVCSMATTRITREKVVKTATYIANDATWVFAILVGLSLVSSFFSIRYLSGIDGDLGALYEKDIRGPTYAQNAYATLLSIESTIKDLALAETEEKRNASAEALRSQSSSLRTLVFKVVPTFDSGKSKTLLADIGPAADALKADLLKLNDVKRRSNLAAFRAVRLQLRLSFYGTIALLGLSIGVRVFLWRGKKRVESEG